MIQYDETLMFFFFQAEDGIRDLIVTGVQTCALPIFFALVKWSKDRRERTFIILNKDRRNQQSFRTQHLARFLAGTAGVEDLSPDGGLMHTDDFQACFVKSS